MNGLTVGNITVKLNGEKQENPNIQNVNGKVTVKYVGDVPAYGSVTVEVTCQIAEGASGTIPANTATLSHGSDKALTDDSDEVTISNISFDVDKFAIADDNTEIVDDGTSNTFKQNIENWEQAQSSDSVIQDKKDGSTYGNVLPGQRLTFYIKITRSNGNTLFGWQCL